MCAAMLYCVPLGVNFSIEGGVELIDGQVSPEQNVVAEP